MKEEILVAAKWLLFWVAIGVSISLFLLIYSLIRCIIKLRKVIKITFKDLLWDIIFILYILIVIIRAAGETIIVFREPIDSLSSFLSIFLGCVVIYAFIKKKLIVFHRTK